MFRLTQQAQALKERDTDTPIVPSDSSSKFSNAGTKKVINATNSDWRSYETHCHQAGDPLEHGWRGGSGGEGAEPCPGLLSSAV